MKRNELFILFLFILFLPRCLFADSPLSEPVQNPDVPYRLYRTTNMWTFIKLDTRDGKMWQLQFDIEGEERFTVTLNDTPLVEPNFRRQGRFTLYPTSNIFTFILLDQLDGRTWQVQWSMKKKERFVIPIEEL